MGRLTPIEAKALTVVETFREGEDMEGAIDALALALDEQAARRASDDGEHLDFVNLVEVEGRGDGICLFGDRGQADRFGAAAHSPTHLTEEPINAGPAAERLIASERGDVLEGMGWPELADDVREGTGPRAILARLRELREEPMRLTALLQRWAEDDAREGGR